MVNLCKPCFYFSINFLAQVVSLMIFLISVSGKLHSSQAFWYCHVFPAYYFVSQMFTFFLIFFNFWTSSILCIYGNIATRKLCPIFTIAIKDGAIASTWAFEVAQSNSPLAPKGFIWDNHLLCNFVAPEDFHFSELIYFNGPIALIIESCSNTWFL